MHNEEWKARWKPVVINHMVPTKWNWIVAYPDKLRLGNFVDIGSFTYINARHGVNLGDNVEIGSHCALYSENSIDNSEGLIEVSAGACIGSHTVIFPGVTIGEGAKIGAHSLVKRNIPAHTTWAGSPVRILNPRKKN